MSSKQVLAAGIVVVAIAATVFWTLQRDGGESSVLGTKVERCKTFDDATAVSPGERRLTAENAPLTVTVSGGRIASVLAPAVKIKPGDASTPRVASFTIGAPRAADGALTADVTFLNLTDCTAGVGVGHAVAQRGGAKSVSSQIRFGPSDRAVVSPGERVAGTFSVRIDGDGTYEITATTDAEIGRVR